MSVNKISSKVPDKFILEQNYPNPFNPSTQIKFALPKSGFVSLKVFDISVKEVADLINENMNVGTYEYEFSGSYLSSGIYFYTLHSNEFSQTKKMLLVK